MSIDLASQFSFPAEAMADFAHRGVHISKQTGDVISYEAGDPRARVQHTFDIVQERNVMQSELYDMDILDDIEVIQFRVPEKEIEDNVFQERVTALPAQLLKFRKIQRTNAAGEKLFYFDGSPQMTFERDETGNLICTGGLFKESYLRWRSGLNRPGLKIESWGRFSGAEVKTLKSEGITTMEQFLQIAPEVLGRFPDQIQARHDEAVKWKRTRDMDAPAGESTKLVKELDVMRKEREQLLSLVKELESKVNSMNDKPEKKTPGRKKKEVPA